MSDSKYAIIFIAITFAIFTEFWYLAGKEIEDSEYKKLLEYSLNNEEDTSFKRRIERAAEDGIITVGEYLKIEDNFKMHRVKNSFKINKVENDLSYLDFLKMKSAN